MKPRKIKGSKLNDAIKIMSHPDSGFPVGDMVAERAEKMLEALRYSIKEVISKGADRLEFNIKLEMSVVGLEQEDDE